MTRPHHVILVPDDPALLVGGFGARPPHATHRAEDKVAHVEVTDDPAAWGPYCAICREAWPCAEPGVVESCTPAHWFAAKDRAHSYWNRESAALVLAWDRKRSRIGLHWLACKAGRGEAWAHEVVRAALWGADTLDALPNHSFPGTLLLLNEKGEVMQSYSKEEPHG